MADSSTDLLARRETLVQQLAALDAAIAAARQGERQATLDKVHALLADGGLTIADLGKPKTKAEPPRKGPVKGRKIAAKYRDPATGTTWSGRGIRPRWMTEALASGKAQDDFLIAKA